MRTQEQITPQRQEMTNSRGVEKRTVGPGGMGAVPCFSEELNNWMQSAWHEKEPDANAFSESKDLMFSLIKRFTQCDKRRVAPPWSVRGVDPGPAHQLEKQESGQDPGVLERFKQWESKQESAHWEHGFFGHKRREEAIIVCEQAGHEAAQEGMGTIDMLQMLLPPPPLRPTRTPSAYTQPPQTIRCTISSYNVREMLVSMSRLPMA